MAIYSGSNPTNPHGLTLLSATNTTVTTPGGSFVTIPLIAPVDLNVGDVFFAALLLPNVPGDLFPFATDRDFANPGGGPPPLGRSFFDVGPFLGAPFYDLNNTANATVLGGLHPVVGFAQDPGNLVLRVTGVASPFTVPEPASLSLLGIGLAGLVAVRMRRSGRKPAA